MPRKKGHKKVGAVKKRNSKKDNVLPLLMGILGAVGGKFLSNAKFVTESTNKDMPKFVAGGELVLGFIVPMFTKNELVRSLSVGLAIGGGVDLIEQMGILNGIMPVLSGYTNLQSVNGLPSELNKFIPDAAQPAQGKNLSAHQIIGSIMMDGVNRD